MCVEGDILSSGTVQLRSNAVVNGSVRAVGGITAQAGAVVNGTVDGAANIDPSDIDTRSVPHNDNHVDVGWATGCEETLSPGTYGSVTVQAGCTLTLESGTYNMCELLLSPDTHLVIEGPVALNVNDGFEVGDRAAVSGIVEPEMLTVYSNQPGQLRLGPDSVFVGILTAPLTEVTIYSRVTFDGCVHANVVRMEPEVFFTGDQYLSNDCGNGELNEKEACDDGNDDNGDDCLTSCEPATCEDGYWHVANETDVDCGGECAPCALGKHCVQDDDCESLLCSNGVCSTPGMPLTADLTITSDCGSVYCANVLLTNNGYETTQSWRVTIDAGDSQIVNLWYGVLSQSGGEYRVDATFYNNIIYPGASKLFGFCAAKTGPGYMPTITSAIAE